MEKKEHLLPPKKPVKIGQNTPIYTDEYRTEKSALRPFGVVLVVVLFAFFSILDAAIIALDSGWSVVVYLMTTALAIYLFRRLWWGDDGNRKIAVFVGFFFAALTFFGTPPSTIENWSPEDWIAVAEDCYFFLSACYLIYVRNDPFFAGPPSS